MQRSLIKIILVKISPQRKEAFSKNKIDGRKVCWKMEPIRTREVLYLSLSQLKAARTEEHEEK